MSNWHKLIEIILVDDDPVVTLLHKNQLKPLGQAPLICSNGLEALHLLRQVDDQNKDFLILLDLHMPVMNGWQFLQALNREALRSEVHVIIVTSSVVQEDFNQALEYEQVIGFCRKPLNNEDVQEIQNLSEIKHFFDSQMPQ